MCPSPIKSARPLTQAEFDAWMLRLFWITHDCVKGINQLDRLESTDEATKYFMRDRGSIGIDLKYMHRFVVITQLAKMFCVSDTQELTFTKLFAALERSKDEPWLTTLMSKERPPRLAQLPRWRTFKEVWAFWREAQGLISKRESILEVICEARNTVLVHTHSAHSRYPGPKPNRKWPTAVELRAVTNIAIHIHGSITLHLDGRGFGYGEGDQSLDQLIKAYYKGMHGRASNGEG